MNKTYKEVQAEWDGAKYFKILSDGGSDVTTFNNVPVLHARDEAIRKAVLEEIKCKVYMLDDWGKHHTMVLKSDVLDVLKTSA